MRILWEGPFETLESLTRVNRNLTEALEKNGVPVYRNDSNAERECDFCVRHQFPPNFSPASIPYIWLQGTELGSFPKNWLNGMMNSAHAYWTYSHYCAEQARGAGIPPSKVEVVPLGVDPDLFNLSSEPYPLPSKKKFCFLFVGGVLYRKGVDLLLDAFTAEFKPEEDVALVIKGSYYYDRWIMKQIFGLIGRSEVPEVILIEELFSSTDLAALYRACNCYVQPYRAEGFGLPILEAMASGLPTILTRGGAALDFANLQNSIQVPAQAYFFPEQDRDDWEMVDVPFCYQADVGLLRQAMRFVYERASSFADFGARVSEEIRSTWTHQHSADWMLNKFKEYKEGQIAESVPEPKSTQHYVVQHNLQFLEHVREFTEFLETFDYCKATS